VGGDADAGEGAVLFVAFCFVRGLFSRCVVGVVFFFYVGFCLGCFFF